MSKIQVNEIVNHFDTGAPDCPKGLTVTGVTTSVNISATNASVSGVSTLGNVVVGGATTDLVVTGDARVTGILTVGTASVTLNGNDGTISGINTVNGVSFPSTGPLSNRNIIINGAMQVAQRATSSTENGITSVDRLRIAQNGSSVAITHSQDADGPAGFANCFKMDITTAASLAATEEFYVDTRLEAQDLQHLKFGTSSAESVTLSFWVKSFQTGQFSIWLFNDDGGRYYMLEYTVNASDTWEYKTITFPGDTASGFNDDNGLGFVVRWYLGAGSNFVKTDGVSTAWAANATDTRITSNQVQLTSSTNNFWKITGVQLEVGTQATPFEHRSFGDELKRCERYFEKSYTYSSSPGTDTDIGCLSARKSAVNSGYTDFNIRFAVRKRATPTIGLYDPNSATEGNIRSDGVSVTGNDVNTNDAGFSVNTDPAQGASVVQQMHYTADAEL